jgi:hypothetical protein
MAKKVFISYSHKDELHKEDLDEHLTMLKRNDCISVWHDRKIMPSDEWKNNIDLNLEEADRIIFLVSPSFLASDYCYDKEVKRAVERHQSGSAKIISVIVRPCDWSACSFSKYQAVPKDGRPITTWGDKDLAWVDAIEGIKKHINEFSPKKLEISKNVTKYEIKPSNKIMEWLNDTEISLTHRKVSKIKLFDIYVVPDIELNTGPKKGQLTENVNIICSSDVTISSESYIISGEEQQGKTSLLKYYFCELLKRKYLPIYLDGLKINKSDIKSILIKSVSEQYECLSYEEFMASSKKIILLDNVDGISLNSKYRNVFLEQLNDLSPRSILSCHSSFSYVFGDIPGLDGHVKANLLGLGNKKREEIVQKWICLGDEEHIEDKDLYSQCDELKSRLNTVIKKNIVPSKPIYVLMLLQMFEANNQLNLELTSYGHCYQQLIYQSFEKAKINKQDFEKYLNVLTELAWWIFNNEDNPNTQQLDEFFKQYCNKYLTVDQKLVIRKLIDHSILSERDMRTGFKYPYIYYYFVGKKFAEAYADSDEVKEQVINLLSKLHREDYANILIFITHHTKDSWVLNEIKEVLNQLFDDQKVASLDKKQLCFMDEFMKKIPELVIEQREIQKERDNHNQRLDDIERSDGAPAVEPTDTLANINKTFKGMEIAGQIIRNRHASLTREALSGLAGCGTSTGLRFLEYFIRISDASKNEIMKVITAHLSEQPNLTDREVERFAEDAYLHLTYGVINAVVRKIASSIGSKEALEIYSQLEEVSGTPAYSLIKLAIELQFNKTLEIKSVSSCNEKLKDNPVCARILREMIIQHIYMFPVDFREKQQLSSLLGISVRDQGLMDQRKIGKG